MRRRTRKRRKYIRKTKKLNRKHHRRKKSNKHRRKKTNRKHNKKQKHHKKTNRKHNKKQHHRRTKHQRGGGELISKLEKIANFELEDTKENETLDTLKRKSNKIKEIRIVINAVLAKLKDITDDDFAKLVENENIRKLFINPNNINKKSLIIGLESKESEIGSKNSTLIINKVKFLLKQKKDCGESSNVAAETTNAAETDAELDEILRENQKLREVNNFSLDVAADAGSGFDGVGDIPRDKKEHAGPQPSKWEKLKNMVRRNNKDKNIYTTK